MTDARPTLCARLFSADPGHSDRPLDFLTVAAVVYLGLPLAVFVAGWLRMPYAVAGSVLLAICTAAALPWPKIAWRRSMPVATAVVIVAVAFAWAAFGGAGHFGYANEDWKVRDAVMSDLVFGGWPPAYGAVTAEPLIMRTALGYFLPAAALAKWLGIGIADVALYVWTALGTALFLLLLPLPQRVGIRLFACLAVAVLFSGMDILGYLSVGWGWPTAPTHLEWWGIAFQYSSNATLLFWAPPHALPAWVASALFYRHWQRGEYWPLAVLTGTFLPIWTPFAAIGIAPFFALLGADRWRKGLGLRIPFAVLLPVLALLYVQFRFLSLSMEALPLSVPLHESYAPEALLIRYAKFIFFEFGLLALILLVSLRHSFGLLWLSCALLLVLPMLRLGPGNDLTMRTSLTALLVLCILCIRILADLPRKELGTGAPLLLIAALAVGAFTPLYEFARTLVEPAWGPYYQQTLLELTAGHPPRNYMARLNRPDVKAFLRPPSWVPRHPVPVPLRGRGS